MTALAELTDHYRWMARYNRWFNQRLFGAAASLNDAERKRDRGAFFGSIHATLNHIMVGDKIWLGRLRAQGAPFDALPAEVVHLSEFRGLGMTLFDDFHALCKHREAMDAAIEDMAAALSPEAVSRPMRYANTQGHAREHPIWQALSHLFNHQTHHRGQVTTLLMQAGIDPGVTDLIALVNPPGAAVS
ncbi:damage-inducible protein DinB [Caldimonas caldifontis]|uniref:Damage-inducible protein DinB n=2 Tax=Caldimonas caldifontis TaxID=1452508 RepID=A0A2S5SSJ1_9BURK|nr:damage-inducible protein DinB [Caldimonas caldifontis]